MLCRPGDDRANRCTAWLRWDYVNSNSTLIPLFCAKGGVRYVPKDVAGQFAARDDMRRFLEEIPLTDELAVAEGDAPAGWDAAGWPWPPSPRPRAGAPTIAPSIRRQDVHPLSPGRGMLYTLWRGVPSRDPLERIGEHPHGTPFRGMRVMAHEDDEPAVTDEGRVFIPREQRHVFTS